jgi:hypothetical protein
MSQIHSQELHVSIDVGYEPEQIISTLLSGR